MVFSDAYFEKAKDEWKTTNPFSGEIQTLEQMRMEDPKETLCIRRSIEPCGDDSINQPDA